MANLDEVRKTVDDYIIKKGYTYRDISLKIGRKDSYVQQYIKYGFPKRLSEVDRKKIANVLGVDEKELIDEELIIDANQKIETLGDKANEFLSMDIVSTRQGDKSDYNLIGRLTLNTKEMGNIVGSGALKLKILRQNSDSMKPLIKNQSLVVYDTGILCFEGDGIYVIKRNDIIEIKQLQKIESNEYAICSLNTKYEKIICKNDEFEILGKAVSVINSSLL